MLPTLCIVRWPRMSIIARALGLVLWLASALDVTASTWTNLVSGDASGSWGKAANWSGGIPNATDASADFTTLNITVNSTLTNDAVRTVGWLLFDDIVPGNKWTLTGSNLVLAASATAPEINVISSGLVTTLALGLTGSQGFIKSGAGTLLLSGGTANTLGGSILITNGVLASDNGASLKNVTGAITVGAGAALSVAANFDGNGNNSPIVLNGMGNGTIGALHGLANQTLTGPITLNTDSKISHDWNNFTLNGGISASSGSNNLEMVISVSGQAPLAANGNVNLGLGSLTIRSVSGGASVMLGGTNTLGGVVVLTNGTVLFNSTNAIGGTGPRVTVNDGAVAALNGSDLNPLLVRVATNSAGAIAFNGTSSSAALNFGSWPNLGLGALGNSTYSGVLTPGGGNYRLGGATGTLTVSSGLTNLDARLVVEGNNSSSTVVLTGKHTYGGATLIHSGTLVVTGALSGPLVVQSAGTLSLGPITNIAALTVGNSVTIYGRILMTINRTNSTTADLLSVSSLIAVRLMASKSVSRSSWVSACSSEKFLKSAMTAPPSPRR